MSVTIRIDPATGMAIASCSGVLRLDDAQEGATALWGTPGWLGRSAVWDFRDARFEVSPPEAREIAQFVLRHQPETPPERMAFVTQREVDYGMARMFEALRHEARTAFRVFRDYDEAMHWARSLGPGAA